MATVNKSAVSSTLLRIRALSRLTTWNAPPPFTAEMRAA
jgi:hypothetical protein